MRRVLLFLLACSASSSPLSAGVLDTFSDLAGWHAVTSHGSASKAALRLDAGKPGNAMLMEFSFLGHMGSAAAEKRFDVPLPANYQLSFDIRGEGLPNNFVIRLMDSLGNVWWVNRSNFVFPQAWTRMTIRKSQIQYGWGPSGGGELKRLDRIMLMIDVVEGGKGKVWFDNLAIEPLAGGENSSENASQNVLLSVSISSSLPGWFPRADSARPCVLRWRTSGVRSREWITLDCAYVRDMGGIEIDWEEGRVAGSFELLLSADGKKWEKKYSAAECGLSENFVYLGSAAARYVKFDIRTSAAGKGIGIKRIALLGPEWGFSVNDFFRGIAAAARRGYYPACLDGEQSYWTIVGAPGDSRKALVNEQGMIEPDRLSCSLEPFLYTGGRLLTWNDARLTQSLEKSYLPIPSVRREMDDSLSLTTTAFVPGSAGRSSLVVAYTVENRSLRRREGALFVALRPFQVNPPWQTFTIVGGAARIDSISYDGAVHLNRISVLPITTPSGFGAAGFDGGDITGYLSRGSLPPAQRVRDHFGYASGALRYDFDIPPGGSYRAVVSVPYHDGGPSFTQAAAGGRDAGAWFDTMRSETASAWNSLLGGIGISLPARARDVLNTVKSNVAYILMAADGPALQPGARSYQRSWVRDGSLTSAALLQMGVDAPVRRYVDWYSLYQYPDGSIPAVVESRGPEPTPENDSHGEFLYMIREYFSFSRDTAWLRGKWDNVRKTVGYIQGLRAQRKTARYIGGTPVERACYGLVPESISHEGYCPAPMHSYWDDFFILRGLKDAAYIARVLGEHAAYASFAAERDDCGADLLASLLQAIRNKGIDFIPGCVELGDFSGLSTTVAVTPCDVTDEMPRLETARTFEESYRMFIDRKENRVAWDSYLPYESRFIGTYVLLGEKERGADVLEYLMHDRRPRAWNEWAEVVWKDPRAPKSIGDMPHSWAASDFIRSFRTMFASEREKDTSLVICAGIPDAWVRDSGGVHVENLPTHFGPVTYSVTCSGNRVIVDIAAGTDIPAGGIRVLSPLSAVPVSIRVGAGAPGPVREVCVRKLPERILFTY